MSNSINNTDDSIYESSEYHSGEYKGSCLQDWLVIRECFGGTLLFREMKAAGSSEMSILISQPREGIIPGDCSLKSNDRCDMVLFCCYRNLLKGLAQLKSLNLEHNQLKHIALGAFMHVPTLRQLSLSHNHLSLRGLQTNVGEVQSVLSACVHLEELYISYNAIITVFSDWVLTMLNLQTLDLSHNLISNLSVSNQVSLHVGLKDFEA